MLKNIVTRLLRRVVAQNPADQWALALAAMYGSPHYYDCLAMQDGDALSSATMLKEAWGIEGGSKGERHDKTFGVLDWLALEGHRADPGFAAPGDAEALQDLLAWDMARCVMVTRHAFNAGYIAEAEAWKFVRQAARLAQPNYASWEEYGRRYLRGRARWSGEREKVLDDAVDFLLKKPKSPWRQLDWRTPLVWAESGTSATPL